LVGKQTVSWPGEAHALHCNHSGEPFAASRVSDERSGKNRRTALDPAPASQSLPVSLDFADAFIDTLSREGLRFHSVRTTTKHATEYPVGQKEAGRCYKTL
jgi:hypothetical protein